MSWTKYLLGNNNHKRHDDNNIWNHHHHNTTRSEPSSRPFHSFCWSHPTTNLISGCPYTLPHHCFQTFSSSSLFSFCTFFPSLVFQPTSLSFCLCLKLAFTGIFSWTQRKSKHGFFGNITFSSQSPSTSSDESSHWKQGSDDRIVWQIKPKSKKFFFVIGIRIHRVFFWWWWYSLSER